MPTNSRNLSYQTPAADGAFDRQIFPLTRGEAINLVFLSTSAGSRDVSGCTVSIRFFQVGSGTSLRVAATAFGGDKSITIPISAANSASLPAGYWGWQVWDETNDELLSYGATNLAENPSLSAVSAVPLIDLYVPLTRQITIGATTRDLAANRTWTLADIGAAATGDLAAYLPLAGGDLAGPLTGISFLIDGGYGIAADATITGTSFLIPSTGYGVESTGRLKANGVWLDDYIEGNGQVFVISSGTDGFVGFGSKTNVIIGTDSGGMLWFGGLADPTKKIRTDHAGQTTGTTLTRTVAITANRQQVYPDKDGTFLLTADLDPDGTLAANSDSLIATQKAVKTYADQLIAAANATVYKGVIDCSANPNYPAADAGWLYRISVAGKIGGASGVNVEVGDIALCLTDGTVSGTQAGVGAAWNIIQANIDGAVVGPASSTDNAIAIFNSTTGKIIKQPAANAPTIDSTGDLRVTSPGTNAASAVTVGGTQTLTNKTLNSPTLVTPTLGAATGTSLVIGSTSQLAIAGVTPSNQQIGINQATGSLAVCMFSTTASIAPALNFYRSKNATPGQATAISSGDYLGDITWYGAQQTGTFATQTAGARIRAICNGTVTSGSAADMPTELQIAVSTDGPTSSLIDAMKISRLGIYCGVNLVDALNVNSISPPNRLLYDQSGNPVMDWGSTSNTGVGMRFYYNGGSPLVALPYGLADSTNQKMLDSLTLRLLSGGQETFDWSAQYSGGAGAGIRDAGSLIQVYTDSTFDGGDGAQGYTINEIVAALKQYKILARDLPA